MKTVAEHLAATLRISTQAYAAGDQVPPCAVLWPDPDRLWESVISELQATMPELYVMSHYEPDKRRGPAVWLRCIEARVVDGAPQTDLTPIFYLPGISRDKLRAVEDCPAELAALVELQYRGMVWLHVNGKEWTPFAYLVSKHGGLGLEVAKDQQTLEALAGALPKVTTEVVAHLQGRRLDAEFFNALVAPDAAGLLLRWLSEPDEFQKLRSDTEWKAFCQQCKSELRFDPSKDGPLRAAQLLSERQNHWGTIWNRFAESPGNYSGIVQWLKRAAPKGYGIFDSAEVWPDLNDREEKGLREFLEATLDRPQDEVIQRVMDLEAQHGMRRSYPWRRLGLSPLATAMEPLAELAELCQLVPGAPDPEAFAEQYALNAWRVDAAAVAAMAACSSQEHHAAILGTLRAIYLPWLESTSRHLQQLIRERGQSIPKRGTSIGSTNGRLVLFADGLRMDVAQSLRQLLTSDGIECTLDWEWSTIPSVTSTAKPAASPIAEDVQGGETADSFSSRLRSTGQLLTQERFVAALTARGWQYIRSGEAGDPTGSGWTEAGAIDKRGHAEGWKLARSIEAEIRDLASRIASLLRVGWTEIIVVTDHGWLLVPGGLPKVELKSFLVEDRWDRCAALKSDAQVDVQTFRWHWNAGVPIASPPGVGCFRASMEYSHGGVSLQEMVTPVLRISSLKGVGGVARLAEAKWTGAKCRIAVQGDFTGLRVDIRTVQADPSSSLLSDRQAREITTDGKVTVFLEEDSDIGKEAEVVLLTPTGQVIDCLSTTLGN